MTNEQNRFVFVNGMGYVFAYRNLIMSWVSRGGGRRWCKQLSGWEILLKNFLSALSAKFQVIPMGFSFYCDNIHKPTHFLLVVHRTREKIVKICQHLFDLSW